MVVIHATAIVFFIEVRSIMVAVGAVLGEGVVGNVPIFHAYHDLSYGQRVSILLQGKITK